MPYALSKEERSRGGGEAVVGLEVRRRQCLFLFAASRFTAFSALVLVLLGASFCPSVVAAQPNRSLVSAQAGRASKGEAFSGGTPALGQVKKPASFLLGPEDVIHISVWKHPDLEQEVLVRPDGVIGLKLVGEVAVEGLTLKQLQDYLTSRYRYFVPEAEVSVTLKEMNSFKVYVLGSVNAPGEFKVGSRLTLLQALALSGGFTPYADERHIKIYTEREGREVILNFDFKQVTKGQANDLVLSPGDRIIVP